MRYASVEDGCERCQRKRGLARTSKCCARVKTRVKKRSAQPLCSVPLRGEQAQEALPVAAASARQVPADTGRRTSSSSQAKERAQHAYAHRQEVKAAKVLPAQESPTACAEAGSA